MSKTYQVELTRTTQKQTLALPSKIRRQIEATINRLEATLNEGKRPQDIKPLKGEPRAYRIDSGEYRVLFYLDDEAATVVIGQVLHRKDAYRNL